MKFEVRNGSFQYDAISRGISGINFTVEEPEILSILGANGAGKTTLIKCMIGLLRWQKGASYIDGTDIRHMRPKDFWRRVGYVPQARLTTFVYTVGEMTLLGRSSHLRELEQPGKKDREIVDECLDLVGMRGLKNKLCSRISGGEYQMVIIARALAGEPSLLVLDEPESNLDFKNQMTVLNTISFLCRSRRISAVINTHYPEHAMSISQKSLLLMPDGTALYGKTGDVLKEDSLRAALGIQVHIEKVRVREREYNCVFPILENQR